MAVEVVPLVEADSGLGAVCTVAARPLTIGAAGWDDGWSETRAKLDLVAMLLEHFEQEEDVHPTTDNIIEELRQRHPGWAPATVENEALRAMYESATGMRKVSAAARAACREALGLPPFREAPGPHASVAGSSVAAGERCAGPGVVCSIATGTGVRGRGGPAVVPSVSSPRRFRR